MMLTGTDPYNVLREFAAAGRHVGGWCVVRDRPPCWEACMRGKRVWMAAVFACALACVMGGCNSTRHGYPKRALDEEAQLRSFETAYDLTELIAAYHQSVEEDGTPDERTKARNKVIDGFLVLTDLHYAAFVKVFSARRKDFDTAADVVVLGLSGAGAVLDPSSTTRILAAISGGVTGTKATVEKNYFYEKTIPILIASMNARREETLTAILNGRKESDDAYPLARAWADLSRYYFAGTFDGALQTIQTDSGKRQAEAEKENSEIRLVPTNPDPLARDARDSVRAWIDADPTVRFDVLSAELTRRGVTLRPTGWLQSASETDIRAVMTALNIPE